LHVPLSFLGFNYGRTARCEEPTGNDPTGKELWINDPKKKKLCTTEWVQKEDLLQAGYSQ
jgi:hypothetical protein